MADRTIMIVDDNPDTQYILGLALETSGYRVESFLNGTDALARAKQGGIDLVVSDILMPDMDGFELCWEIKSNEKTKNIPFVFYTAYYKGRSDERFAMNLGAQKFICKPADPDEFVGTIRQVIQDCEKGIITSQDCAYRDIDTFLKDYVHRLKGSIEKNILGMDTDSRAENDSGDREAVSEAAPLRQEEHAGSANPGIDMRSYEDVIITTLSSSRGGFTTNRLAKTTGISRTTIIKYLSVLKERKIVDFVNIGPSKLWFSTKKSGP
ncbi:MAG TPA: response regulator [Candidatus Methanoperedenaceae archaeon]|nr:response regulator [Candidatus Methanoperedenaceae archaeon]